MKNMKKYQKSIMGIAAASVLVIIIFFICFSGKDTKEPEQTAAEETGRDTAVSSVTPDQDREQEPSPVTEDPYYVTHPEVIRDYDTVYYGDTEIIRYEGDYEGNAEYRIAQYFTRHIGDYVEMPENFDPHSSDYTMEDRGNVFLLNIPERKIAFDINGDENNENLWYVKITDYISEDPDMTYYRAELKRKDDKHFDINVTETTFAEISPYVETITEEVNPKLDDNYYYEEMYRELTDNYTTDLFYNDTKIGSADELRALYERTDSPAENAKTADTAED